MRCLWLRSLEASRPVSNPKRKSLVHMHARKSPAEGMISPEKATFAGADDLYLYHIE